MEHLTILIKPASSLCNMRCRYCFYSSIADIRENASYGIMSEETADNIIKKALQSSSSVSFAFQGGEPTIAGLGFFRTFVEKVKEYNTGNAIIKATASNAGNASNSSNSANTGNSSNSANTGNSDNQASKGIKNVFYSMQTNGLNIDEEFAAFLKVNNFLVGLSIDGYKEIHDFLRVDSKGDGTFNRIMKTVRLFEKHKVDFNVLTVINAYTAKHIEKIYTFFKKNNFRYLQFIPCLDPLDRQPLEFDYSLTPALYGKFLKTLFKLYYDDFMNDNYVSIRFFDNLVRVAAGQPSEQCGMLGFCSGQFVIEGDGTVFPCDFYCVDNWQTGNINEMGFDEIYKSDKMQEFIRTSIYDSTKCKACDVYNLCRGGCRRDRDIATNGIAGDSNIYCEALHDFYKFSGPYINQIQIRLNLNQQ